MTELVELAKRRGFFFQSSEAYGGVSGFYVYGPQGAALKRNIEDSWRDRFQVQEGHRDIEAPTIMPEPVFEASGHLDGFDDMLVECPECGESHRADHLIEDNTDIEDAEALPLEEVGELIADHDLHCPTCDTPLAGEPVEDFNLMFSTDIGPGYGTTRLPAPGDGTGYLRGVPTTQGVRPQSPPVRHHANRHGLPERNQPPKVHHPSP